MISTTMPLTSAYSQHQNISDEMNIYVHQETKSTNGNASHLKIIYSYFVTITGYKLIFSINIFIYIYLETYNDPLGPLQRPRTSTSRPITSLEKEFANEQVQDLLPE